MGKITVVDIVLRLLGAVIVGFAVGAQRARTSHPAGIRTHILVALGSCVVMVTSCIMYEQTIAVFGTTPSDPARLGAQVINGIGFLGAGAILREGFTVRGLTTAASVWVVACLGLSVGMGYYVLTAVGTLIVGDIEKRFEQGSVVVAAANPDVLEDYIGPHDMVILGNRYESQLCAIEMNAGCIIIGLGAKVSRTIRKLASENQVSIIATPLTTYSCAKVVSQAVPVRHVMRRRGLITFEPDDVVEDVKRAVSKKRMRYYPLLDEQGRYIGMFSQRNLLDLERPSVILVDHNERDQAAEGIRSTNIVEIIDHHRIDSVETSGPIYFRNQPLGCTATIITQMYHEHNVEIEPKIAGLLCSAILSDTLMFRSPTCTPLDRMAAEELAKIAGLDIKQYATEMFRSSSRLLDRSMDELFHMDFKYFQAQNQKIAISQVTSVSENELSGIRDKMLEYMESCLASSGLSMLFAMLTNIIEEKTELLYVGKGAQQLVRAAFKTDCGEHSVVLPGVVSRKKQMVAPLVRAMEHDEEIG